MEARLPARTTQQLLVERLPLYTLVHRFKPQAFLPRVMRYWARLYDLGLSLESAELRVRGRRMRETRIG